MQTMPDDHETAADTLRRWLARHRRVFVLTGAGVSTASGIPDYRGRDGQWKRPPPVTFQAFVQEPAMRARYWARAFVGWPRFSAAVPNAAHAALGRWEERGGLSMLLTQNVDALHQKAGSRAVVDLHGRLDRVHCLDCGDASTRDEVQRWMQRANPGWSHVDARVAPDGDADVDHAGLPPFVPPACRACGGLLKPDVVFFGENVPRECVDVAFRALSDSDAMLVVGSSLMVYSGFRFARMARESGLELAILTRGATRADDIATIKLEADCVEVLPRALA